MSSEVKNGPGSFVLWGGFHSAAAALAAQSGPIGVVGGALFGAVNFTVKEVCQHVALANKTLKTALSIIAGLAAAFAVLTTYHFPIRFTDAITLSVGSLVMEGVVFVGSSCLGITAKDLWATK